MNHRRWIIALIALTLLGLSPACTSTTPTGNRLDVFVSILPQAYFVEQIGGNRVTVHVLVGPGQSPETYEPTPRQMSELDSARLYFTTGVPFESTMLRKLATLTPGVRIVDTTVAAAGMEDPEQAESTAETGSMAADSPAADTGTDHHDHLHGETDPHIWLDPELAREQSRIIAEALAAADPAHAAEYRRNLARLDAELERTDRRIAEILAPDRGRILLVFHPAFGHFARRYHLRQLAIETGGKEPSLKRMTQLIELAREKGIRVIFVQPQFSEKAAKVIAEAIGGRVVSVDPLAKDYPANLLRMARAIAAAYAGH